MYRTCTLEFMCARNHQQAAWLTGDIYGNFLQNEVQALFKDISVLMYCQHDNAPLISVGPREWYRLHTIQAEGGHLEHLM
jgi:hypothetical protein